MEHRNNLRFFSPRASASRRAFTRLELLACVAALALLAALALPALATTQSRSHVVQCLNNLRLVSRGVQMWGADHGNQSPWRTAVTDGGTYQTPKPGAAWLEYSYISNELVTPRILACSADTGVRVADAWLGPDSYTSVQYRGNATSYFLNLHALSELPLAPVGGDRNIRFTSTGQSCIAGVINADGIDFADPNVGWTNAVHGLEGNTVLMDGTVATTTSTELRAGFARSEDDNGTGVHLLRAR